MGLLIYVRLSNMFELLEIGHKRQNSELAGKMFNKRTHEDALQ